MGSEIVILVTMVETTWLFGDISQSAIITDMVWFGDSTGIMINDKGRVSRLSYVDEDGFVNYGEHMRGSKSLFSN